MKKNIAVFSSGRGGNFNNICEYFKATESVSVCLLVTSNLNSASKQIADKYKIETLFANVDILRSVNFTEKLQEKNISLVVLAGFILKVPKSFVLQFAGKMINLHPSLLPKFGGKGMYGDNVHLAVLESKERFSGITIHFVDEIYDNGEIIFQKSCHIDNNETLLTLREKIRKLEYEFFPKVIEQILLKNEC